MKRISVQGGDGKRPGRGLGLLMALAAWNLAGCSGGDWFRRPTIIDASRRDPAAATSYRSAPDSAAADDASAAADPSGRYDPDYRTAAATRWQAAPSEAQAGWGRAPQYRAAGRTAYPPRSQRSAFGQTGQVTMTPETDISRIDPQVPSDRQIPSPSMSPVRDPGADLDYPQRTGRDALRVTHVEVTEIPSDQGNGELANAAFLSAEPGAVDRGPSGAAAAPSVADRTMTDNTTASGAAALQVAPPALPDPQGDYQPAVSVAASPSLTPTLGRAVSELETFLAAHPRDSQVMLALHFLYQVQQRTQEAQQVLARDERLVGPMLELLEDLRGRLARQGDFVISCVKLCSQVEGFGRYQEIPPADLQSGLTRQMYVYCVLENFQSKRDAEGKYVADIHMDVSLFDGRYRVLRQISEDVPDTPSFHVRRDFFVLASLPLPSLAPGRYQLRVQMEDKIAGKLTRPEDIFFEVKGQQDSGAETPGHPADKTAD
ncbi:MAG: hypothetical protein JW810_08210 [Sedimentisphaerales bacterium]|nr:hypothetical protein [Sedimentisphaerales bacterium]